MPSILIIDDETNMRHMLSKLLQRAGYETQTAAHGKLGLTLVHRQTFDFILCDIKMPEMDGLAFLNAAQSYLADTLVIMMSAYGTIDIALEAMQLGAYDYISKPFKPDEVHLALRKALERENLRRENRHLKACLETIEERHQFGRLVAQSKPMRQVFGLATRAARYSHTTVLISGDSGTGKELLARAIHFNSSRAKKPWVALNCGEIPENLLESELFGYKKGAFTGADRDKKGLFEEAHTGTIFLDEIGDLPIGLQVKLLRVLQESEIRAVGNAKPRSIDVRVIAATSKTLTKEIQAKRFREDLFYRLNVLAIHVPPLRLRMDDLPLLVAHFITELNTQLDRNVDGMAPDALKQLMRCDWPGNVRELRNIIERSMIMCDGNRIEPGDLPPEIAQKSAPNQIFSQYEGYSLKIAQKMLEHQMIDRALEATQGNRTQAARMLEISHPSLLSKIKTYGIDR